MEFKRICFILSLLFLLSGTASVQTVDTSDTGTLSLTAGIIHRAENRIYLNMGEISGLDQSWQIRWPVGKSDTINLPFSWIGQDISCFVRPDSIFHNYQVADSIRLFRLPTASSKGSKIILAWPHAPALPHQDRKDLYDRMLCNLLCEPLRSLPVTHMTQGPLGGPNPFARSLFFSDGGEISPNQPYYTFNYFSKRLSFSNYLLKFMPDVYNKSNWLRLDYDSMTIPRYIFLINGINIPLIKAAPLPDNPGDTTIKAKWIPENYEIDTTYNVTGGHYFIAEKNNREITLIKNKFYHGKTLPDTIIIKIEPDYLKRKLMFQLGEIDFLDLNFSDVDQFKADYIVREAPLAEAVWLTVNNLKNSQSDGVLAAALSYLINKESLCRVVLGNSAQPLDDIIPKWADDIKSIYGYDRNKGRSLLKKMGTIPRYLSLYISPDDFWNRRTAEYIKGILERENIYITIYSEMLSGEGRPYDLFQQFDMMLGRIDFSRTSPIYILNQLTFHYDLAQVTSNRSLYYAPEYDSVLSVNITGREGDPKKLHDYYRGLTEIPVGICLFKPIRQMAASRRITNFALDENGVLILGSIEFADETKR